MVLLLLLLACAADVPACGDGQHVTASMECADDPTVPGSEDFPACEALPAGTRIDVNAGCADGACHDTTFDAMNEALGEVGVCSSAANLAFCDWSMGIGTFFADDDGDDAPDEGALGSGIFLDPPFDGTTEDGLGLGVSMRCWVERYGYTDEVEYQDDGAWITELYWTPEGLFVHDEDGDGYVDEVSLFGI